MADKKDKNAPVIPRTTIVELKQTNENSNSSNPGDWNTTLDNPIVIREGDEVSLKSAFVDSASAGVGLIEVQPDDPDGTTASISITNGYYINNIPSSLETEFKIATPTDAAYQRLVISKVYDPVLELNGNAFAAGAGVGRAAIPDKGAAPVDASITGLNALNVRMTGEPYVAYHVSKHAAGDPGRTAQEVSKINIDFKTLNSVHSLLTPTSANAVDSLTFDIIYWPAGPQGQVAGKQKSAKFSLQVKGVDPNLMTKFFSTFTGAGAGTLTIDPGLVDNNPANNPFHAITMAAGGTTLSFPIFMNDQEPLIHFVKAGGPHGAMAVPVFGFPIAAADYRNSANVSVSNLDPVDSTTEFSIYPATRTTKFHIEAKKYTNAELASVLTNAMTAVDSRGSIPGNVNLLANSGILATSRGLTLDLNPTFTTHDGTLANNNLGGNTFNNSNIEEPIIFGRVVRDAQGNPLSVDGDTIFDTFRMNDLDDKSLNYIVGSQNFALEWDDDESKYEFTSLHTPLYDLSPGTDGQSQIRQYTRAPSAEVPAAGAAPRRPQIFAEKFWANKYSGIFLTDVSPPSLFHTDLKFGSDLIVPVAGSLLCKDRNGREMAVHGATINLQDGVNITGDFDGVGAVVQRLTPHFPPDDATAAIRDKIKPLNDDGLLDDRAGVYQCYDVAAVNTGFNIVGASGAPPVYISANENRQIPIIAKDHIDVGEYAEVDDPYYKIEVGSKLFNNIAGDPNYNRSVSSIISKYYASGNFTSSYNEGSISYIHKGQPVTIDNFKCRILNSEGQLAGDVGNRNSIFLEITKVLDE